MERDANIAKVISEPSQEKLPLLTSPFTSLFTF